MENGDSKRPWLCLISQLLQILAAKVLCMYEIYSVLRKGKTECCYIGRLYGVYKVSPQTPFKIFLAVVLELLKNRINQIKGIAKEEPGGWNCELSGAPFAWEKGRLARTANY